VQAHAEAVEFAQEKILYSSPGTDLVSLPSVTLAGSSIIRRCGSVRLVKRRLRSSAPLLRDIMPANLMNDFGAGDVPGDDSGRDRPVGGNT
jgi:hypothetical protein